MPAFEAQVILNNIVTKVEELVQIGREVLPRSGRNDIHREAGESLDEGDNAHSRHNFPQTTVLITDITRMATAEGDARPRARQMRRDGGFRPHDTLTGSADHQRRSRDLRPQHDTTEEPPRKKKRRELHDQASAQTTSDRESSPPLAARSSPALESSSQRPKRNDIVMQDRQASGKIERRKTNDMLPRTSHRRDLSSPNVKGVYSRYFSAENGEELPVPRSVDVTPHPKSTPDPLTADVPMVPPRLPPRSPTKQSTHKPVDFDEGFLDGGQAKAKQPDDVIEDREPGIHEKRQISRTKHANSTVEVLLNGPPRKKKSVPRSPERRSQAQSPRLENTFKRDHDKEEDRDELELPDYPAARHRAKHSHQNSDVEAQKHAKRPIQHPSALPNDKQMSRGETSQSATATITDIDSDHSATRATGTDHRNTERHPVLNGMDVFISMMVFRDKPIPGATELMLWMDSDHIVGVVCVNRRGQEIPIPFDSVNKVVTDMEKSVILHTARISETSDSRVFIEFEFKQGLRTFLNFLPKRFNPANAKHFQENSRAGDIVMKRFNEASAVSVRKRQDHSGISKQEETRLLQSRIQNTATGAHRTQVHKPLSAVIAKTMSPNGFKSSDNSRITTERRAKDNQVSGPKQHSLRGVRRNERSTGTTRIPGEDEIVYEMEDHDDAATSTLQAHSKDISGATDGFTPAASKTSHEPATDGDGDSIASRRRSMRTPAIEKAKASVVRTRPVEKLFRWSKELVYPPTGRNKATVEYQDLDRLQSDEFLNDNLIEFCLRYIEQCNKDKNRNIYVFNTYFYASLTSGCRGKKNINYEAVKKWTAKTDLFLFDYVVVPINEKFHWYAAIMCNPKNIRRQMEPDLPVAGLLSTGTQNAEGLASSPTSVSGKDRLRRHESPGTANDITEVSGLQSAVRDLRHASDTSNEAHTSEETPQMHAAVNEVLELEATGKPAALVDSRPGNKSGVEVEQQNKRKLDENSFVILTLDSFGQTHGPAIRNLKDYIVAEAKEKRGMQIDEPYGKTAKGIPLQNNFSDCGLYLVGYVHKLFENPTDFSRRLLSTGNESHAWRINAAKLRDELKDIILDKYSEQNPNERIREKIIYDDIESDSEQEEDATPEDPEEEAERQTYTTRRNQVPDVPAQDEVHTSRRAQSIDDSQFSQKSHARQSSRARSEPVLAMQQISNPRTIQEDTEMPDAVDERDDSSLSSVRRRSKASTELSITDGVRPDTDVPMLDRPQSPEAADSSDAVSESSTDKDDDDNDDDEMLTLKHDPALSFAARLGSAHVRQTMSTVADHARRNNASGGKNTNSFMQQLVDFAHPVHTHRREGEDDSDETNLARMSYDLGDVSVEVVDSDDDIEPKVKPPNLSPLRPLTRGKG